MSILAPVSTGYLRALVEDELKKVRVRLESQRTHLKWLRDEMELAEFSIRGLEQEQQEYEAWLNQ